MAVTAVKFAADEDDCQFCEAPRGAIYEIKARGRTWTMCSGCFHDLIKNVMTLLTNR